MHTMDQKLADLVNTGVVTHKAAMEKVHDAEGFDRLVTRVDQHVRDAGPRQRHRLRRRVLEEEQLMADRDRLRLQGAGLGRQGRQGQGRRVQRGRRRHPPPHHGRRADLDHRGGGGTGLQREISIGGFGDGGVKMKDIAVMSRQMATMIGSGLSLLRTLDDPRRPGREQDAGEDHAAEVRDDVETGVSFSDAVGEARQALPAADDQHDPCR